MRTAKGGAFPWSPARRIAVVAALILVVSAASAIVLYLGHIEAAGRTSLKSASLCSNVIAAAPYFQPPNEQDNVRQPVVSLGEVSTTDAAHAAADMRRAHLSPHPWDQQPPHAAVAECQIGSSVWYIDSYGHETRRSAT